MRQEVWFKHVFIPNYLLKVVTWNIMKISIPLISEMLLKFGI